MAGAAVALLVVARRRASRRARPRWRARREPAPRSSPSAHAACQRRRWRRPPRSITEGPRSRRRSGAASVIGGTLLPALCCCRGSCSPVAWRPRWRLGGLGVVGGLLGEGRPVGPAELRPCSIKAPRQDVPTVLGAVEDARTLARPDRTEARCRDAEPLEPLGLRAGGGLASFPPVERWDDWVEYDAKALAAEGRAALLAVPTICFNCEAACGLLAYVDQETCRSRSSRATPRTRAAAAATAPRGRRRSTRSTTPSASSTRCGGWASAGQGSGSA